MKIDGDLVPVRRWSDLLWVLVQVLVLVLHCSLAVAVSSHAFSLGNPDRLLHPTDSAGEVCGRGELADRPHLLHWDLSQCWNLSVHNSTCPSSRLCVSTCPDVYWTYPLGSHTKNSVKQFCAPMSQEHWDTTDLLTLVTQSLCPAYLVPTTDFLGHCIPTLGLTTSMGEQEVMKEKVQRMQRSSGQAVEAEHLEEGIKYLVKRIDLQDSWERTLVYVVTSWRVLLFLLLPCVSVLGWILFLRVIPRSVIFRNKSIVLVTDVLWETKTVILIPTLQLLILLPATAWFVTVSCYLATTGTKEFKVVSPCSMETCENPNTRKVFLQEDVCNPWTFGECTSCPSAKCIFHDYTSSQGLFRAINCLLFVHFVSFTDTVFRTMTMRAVSAWWHTTPSVFLTSATQYLGKAVLWSLVLPVLRIVTVTMAVVEEVLHISLSRKVGYFQNFLNFTEDKDVFAIITASGTIFHCDMKIGKQEVLTKTPLQVTGFINFASKLLISSHIFSYLLISLVQLHWCIILILTYLVTSVFFSMYNTALATVIYCYLEDRDKPKESRHWLCAELEEIVGQRKDETTIALME